eukprot:2964050-Amphidinium_carterae.1
MKPKTSSILQDDSNYMALTLITCGITFAPNHVNGNRKQDPNDVELALMALNGFVCGANVHCPAAQPFM